MGDCRCGSLCSNAALSQPDLSLDEAAQFNLQTDTKTFNRSGLPDPVVPETDEAPFASSFVPNDAHVGSVASDTLWEPFPATNPGFQIRQTSFGVGSFASGALGFV